MIITVANISIGPNPICGHCTLHECAVQLGKTRVTPEWRPKKRSHCDLKIADGRGARFAVASNAKYTRCMRAVPSHKTTCGGGYFEHAQRQRRGFAFALRARLRAVGTLWQRFGSSGAS